MYITVYSVHTVYKGVHKKGFLWWALMLRLAMPRIIVTGVHYSVVHCSVLYSSVVRCSVVHCS